MRYIRTQEGIAEDAGTDALGLRCVRYKRYKVVLSQEDDVIVKEADTLEDLIMPEDLVEVDYIDYYRIEKDRGDYLLAYSKDIIERKRITAWFINVAKDPEMEGRFIQTAERNEQGELELL